MDTTRRKKIAPSILASDFSRLAEEIEAVKKAGADWIHIDVMDGMFVPNITIGIPVVRRLREVTKLPLDVHLMIERPERYVEEFADVGADIITIHIEATVHADRAIELIKSRGKKAGISLNPGTSLAEIDSLLTIVDMILIMSVNPGFGGQKLIPYTIDKIKRLRETLDVRGIDDVLIEIDGGITEENISDAAEAGVDVFVAGSAIFGTDDYSGAILNMRSKYE